MSVFLKGPDYSSLKLEAFRGLRICALCLFLCIAFEIVISTHNPWIEQYFLIFSGMTMAMLQYLFSAKSFVRVSEEHFMDFVYRSTDLVALQRRRDGKYMDINRGWEFYTGFQRSEIIGRAGNGIIRFFDEKGNPLLEDALTMAVNKRVQYTTKSGKKRSGFLTSLIFEVNGEEHLFYYISDTTDRDSLRELSRHDKLDTVGQMAVAIGHEIRNPMTTVRGYLQLMLERGENVLNIGCLDLMIRELDRANAIISEFLFLANNKLAKRSLQDLNALLESLYPELSADALLESKMILLDLGNIPLLQLDVREIKQLTLNLVRNALEATEKGGKVTIQTFSEGSNVVLAVKDEGPGIDPEIREKIGLPFTSTKDHGTGLGLAVCYCVAKRHDAKISFDTGPEGTTFFVRFAIHPGEG